MAGMVNAVTRSGGNSFHGAGYGYLAKPTLSSAERYAMGRSLFQSRARRAGAWAAGSPGKVFFFLHAEVLNGSFQDMNRITSPMIANSAAPPFYRRMQGIGGRVRKAATQFIQAQMNVVSPLSERLLTDWRRSIPPQRPQHLRRRS